MYHKLSLIISVCLLFNGFLFAQSKEIKSATIVDFDEPYEFLIINSADIGEDVTFLVDTLIAIKSKKGDDIKASELQEGQEVSIVWEIRDEKRVAIEIKLLTEPEIGRKKFTGLFEGYDGNVAFIDGKQVQLNKGATFKGEKKGEGKINIDFIGFKDDLLKKGYYMNVKGNLQSDGIIHADEIIVRKNTATKSDEEIIELVNKGFRGDGLNQLQISGGMLAATSNLQNANVVVGNVTYKLTNDIKLQGYINEIGYKLIPEYTSSPAWQKENQKIDFRFYVVQDDIPNAYAWPNGMVFIHTGLLKIIKNEAQLAFVLSHEISHVLYEHGSARYEKSEKIKDLVGYGKGAIEKAGSILTGGIKLPTLWGNKPKNQTSATSTGKGEYEYYAMMQKVFGLGGTGSSVTAKVSQSDKLLTVALNKAAEKITPDALSGLFGKDQENQADRVGLYYTQLAGYDIREVPKFWIRMIEKNDDPTFLSNMADGAKALIQNPLNNLGLGSDTKSQLLNSSSTMLVNNIFKSVYSSHPISQNRLKNINQLLTSTYKTKDYISMKIGEDEYKNQMSGL